MKVSNEMMDDFSIQSQSLFYRKEADGDQWRTYLILSNCYYVKNAHER